ncbi:chemotaxis protein CheE [Brevundimonas sp. R86498]|uniref:chemotaxis protein CheE n=1 Tax=Brevundimonas sp. R86498 TaxID=3093845 RepID=UPI0037C54975
MKQQSSRLSQLIDAPGGLTVAVALKNAETNLAPLRDPALAIIDRHIAVLAAIDRPGPGEPSDTLDEIYGAATAIIDCASPFDLDDLCAVAAGLCDLVRDVSPERPFDWRVPAVYARTMALLLTLPVEARDQRHQVRKGIDAILARKRSPRD